VHLLRLFLVLAFGFLISCYPDPTFPEVEPASTSDERAAEVSKRRSTPSPAAVHDGQGGSAQYKRRQDVVRQLERVGTSAGVSRKKRPGADEWRPVELEKLGEIITSCCSSSEVACRDCLTPLVAAPLATDELWHIYGSFLGPLRNRAAAGVEVLGAMLLQHEEGRVRDRALRVAVGSGITPRGEESPGGYRISTLPRAPMKGEPVLIILEHNAPCTEVTGEVKGPDEAGRIDLDPFSRCPEVDEAAKVEFVPKATRYVFTHRVEAMPEPGLSIWLPGGKQPLLRLTPARASDSRPLGTTVER